MSLNGIKNNAATESVENGSPKQDQTYDLSDTADSQDTLAESPGFPDHDAILERYPHFKAFLSKDRIQKNTSPLEGTKEKVQPSDGQCNLEGQMKLQEEVKLLKMKMEEQKECLTKVFDTFKEKSSNAISAFRATFNIISRIADSTDAMATDVAEILIRHGQSVEQVDPGFEQLLQNYFNGYVATKEDVDRITTTFCTLHNRLITENCDFINKQMDNLRKAIEKLPSTVESVKEIVREEICQQLQIMHCRAPIVSHPNSSHASSDEISAPLDYTFKHLNSVNIKKKINDDTCFIGKRKHIFQDQSIQKTQYSRYFQKKTIPPYSTHIGCMEVNGNAEGQQQKHQNDVRKDSVKVIIADASKPHENSAFANSEDKNVTHSPGEVKIEPKRQKIGTSTSTENIGASVTSPVPHPKKRKKKNAQWHKDKIPKENILKAVPAKEKETFPIEDDDCVIVAEISGIESFSNNTVDIKGKNTKPK